MKRLLLALPLLFSGIVSANTILELGDNVVALAAANAKVSMFSKTVSLPDGKHQLVIKFDSPTNPESVNQGRGRLTSAPYIITFNYNGNDPVLLSAGKVSDENEAKKEAQNPSFSLTANNTPVKFNIKKIDQDSVNLFSDFKSMLVADSSELQDINIQPEVKDGVDKVKNAYNKLSDKQKLIFMKWLMNN
ncbi:DUF2057 domain-containing protein [Salmonella enterica subsp. enterica serovar Toulon]|nr:DUF2057 domain-containing protein [Salmonella enterica subsp. enterica serovar Toulon]